MIDVCTPIGGGFPAPKVAAFRGGLFFDADKADKSAHNSGENTNYDILHFDPKTESSLCNNA